LYGIEATILPRKFPDAEQMVMRLAFYNRSEVYAWHVRVAVLATCHPRIVSGVTRVARPTRCVPETMASGRESTALGRM
jgi:hypothetical protein